MNIEAPMRDRIMSAAAASLVQYGTQSSMAKIANLAGVAIGSLYNHFKNKDEMLYAVYEELGKQMNAALIARDPAPTAEARFDDYVAVYIDFIWSDPDRAVLFEYLSNVPLIPPESMITAFSECSIYIHKICWDLIDEGKVPGGDPTMMGAFVGGSIRNTLKWHRTLEHPLEDTDRATILKMCRRAIGLGA